MGQLRASLIAVLTLFSLALHIAPSAAQAASSAGYVFTPPAIAPPFPDTVIGILRANASGSLLDGPATGHDRRDRAAVAAMVRASDLGLAKIIVSKGLRTGGTNLDRGETSATHRAKLVLLLDPTLHFDLGLARLDPSSDQACAVIKGQVTLVFRDPDSGAGLWTKQIPIVDFARPERLAKSSPDRLDKASVQDLLHAFYPVMMQQIWQQLDAMEFRVLAIKMVQD